MFNCDLHTTQYVYNLHILILLEIFHSFFYISNYKYYNLNKYKNFLSVSNSLDVDYGIYLLKFKLFYFSRLK